MFGVWLVDLLRVLLFWGVVLFGGFLLWLFGFAWIWYLNLGNSFVSLFSVDLMFLLLGVVCFVI